MARPSVKTINVLRVGVALVTAFVVTTVKADEGLFGSPKDYRAGVLSAEFPYESRYIEVLGSKMHYIDQGQGVGAGLAFQHCRHGGPSKCTAPSQCGTGLRSGLVHSDILGATIAGDSLHDFCPAAQTRALSQWPDPASKQPMSSESD